MVSKSIIFKIDVIPHFTLNMCGVFNMYLSFSKDMGKTELQKSTSLGTRKEKFYLHLMVFSIHPIREMGCKYGVCVIWGCIEKNMGCK